MPVATPDFQLKPRREVTRAAWTMDAEPLFLVGCPRSGTTWLQSLISCHPEVYTGAETQFFPSAHLMEREFWKSRNHLRGVGAYLEPPEFYGCLREFFWKVVSTLPEPETTPRYFLEKSPHHALVGETVLNTFPRARFINLVRDPRTTVASLLRAHRSWAWNWAPGTVGEATDMWIAHWNAARMIGDTLCPEQFLELTYEECASSPEAALSRIWSWLGLPYSSGSVAEAVVANALRGESTTPFPGITMPTVALNGDRAVFPKDFVSIAARTAADTELTAAELRAIEDRVGPLLRRAGYLPAPGLDAVPNTTPAPPCATSPQVNLTVILVGEGDNPMPLADGIEAMLPAWQDDWELILAPNHGRGCELVASGLGGDFQLLPQVEGETFRQTLFRAAEAARSRYLLIPREQDVFHLKRGELMQFGGCRGNSRAHVLAWLNWRADRRPDLLQPRS
jgi:hypothetical protein